jgi:hypothetical protein
MQGTLDTSLVGVVGTFEDGRGAGYERRPVKNYGGIHYWSWRSLWTWGLR